MKLDRKERIWAKGGSDDDEDDGGEGEETGNNTQGVTMEKQVYDNDATTKMYGGSVTVSISYGNPYGAESAEDKWRKELDECRKKEVKGRDTEQWKAGNVGVFMEGLKKNMPSKKDTKGKTGAKGFTGKGKHGAQDKIGGKGVKFGKKMLGKFQDKAGGMEGKGKASRKGKGGRGAVPDDGRGKGKKRKRPH